MPEERWKRRAWALAPYLGLLLVAWRQLTLERSTAHFVETAQRVLDTASADIAAKAADLHDSAVTHSASQN